MWQRLYAFNLELLAKKLQNYLEMAAFDSSLYIALDQMIPQIAKDITLKKLDEHFDRIKPIANTVRDHYQQQDLSFVDFHYPPTRMIDCIDSASKQAEITKEMLTMFLQYYRSMRLMEHAKPQKQADDTYQMHADQCQSSNVLRLPTNLMNMLFQYYRSIRWMQYAKPQKQTGGTYKMPTDQWQASQALRLPTNLMKMIAYQAAKPEEKQP